MYSGPEADGPLFDLPASDLEDALHRVLVEVQQSRYRTVAKRWILVDHGFDGLLKALLHLGRSLAGLVISRAPGHLKPAAQLAHGDLHAL